MCRVLGRGQVELGQWQDRENERETDRQDWETTSKPPGKTGQSIRKLNQRQESDERDPNIIALIGVVVLAAVESIDVIAQEFEPAAEGYP